MRARAAGLGALLGALAVVPAFGVYTYFLTNDLQQPNSTLWYTNGGTNFTPDGLDGQCSLIYKPGPPDSTGEFEVRTVLRAENWESTYNPNPAFYQYHRATPNAMMAPGAPVVGSFYAVEVKITGPIAASGWMPATVTLYKVVNGSVTVLVSDGSRSIRWGTELRSVLWGTEFSPLSTRGRPGRGTGSYWCSSGNWTGYCRPQE